MEEQIIKSVALGDMEAVNKFLESGVATDIQDGEGTTPLQVAAANGFDEIAELLLLKSARVDLPNAYGWTPLMLAARHGHCTMVTLLIKNKAKINIFNKLGMTPLAAAVCSGSLEVVSILIEAGSVVDPSPLGVMNPLESELTPIMMASYLGNDSILGVILEKGAPVNQLSAITGWSPLMLAACGGHKQSVHSLVAWGADTRTSDICGRTALDIALNRGHLEVRTHLENVTELGPSSALPRKEMLEAVKTGDIHQVRLILMNDPHAANKSDPDDGITALMSAAIGGYLKIVELLLEHHAKVDAQDLADGWTALMHAVFRGHADIVKLLLENGADVNLKAKNGYNAVDLARYTDNAEGAILKLLSDVQEPVSDVASELSKEETMTEFGSSSSREDILAETTSVPRRKTSLGFKVSSRLRLSLRTSSASSRKSSLDVRRSPKYSPRSSKLKGLVEEVASRLQTLVPKKSGNASDSASSSAVFSPSQFDSTISDEVFEKSAISESQVPMKPMLCLSSLKAPEKYLADCLKKHIVEPIVPPVLPDPYEDDDFELSLMQEYKKSQKRQGARSLMTPNLLKSCAAEIDQIISQNEIPCLSASSYSTRGRRSSGKNVKFKIDGPDEISPLFKGSSSFRTPVTSGSSDRSKMSSSSNVSIVKASGGKKSSRHSSDGRCESKKSVRFQEDGLKSTMSKQSRTSASRPTCSFEESSMSQPSVIPKKSSSNASAIEIDDANPAQRSYNRQDIEKILKEKSLEKHAQKFKEQEVDIEALQYFTDEDLQEMGINTLTSRVKLLEIVEKLNRPND